MFVLQSVLTSDYYHKFAKQIRLGIMTALYKFSTRHICSSYKDYLQFVHIYKNILVTASSPTSKPALSVSKQMFHLKGHIILGKVKGISPEVEKLGIFQIRKLVLPSQE